MGTCPSTNTLPPTGPLPVEPRHQKQLVDDAPLPSPIAQQAEVVSADSSTSRDQTLSYLAVYVRRLTAEYTMNCLVRDRWVLAWATLVSHP